MALFNNPFLQAVNESKNMIVEEAARKRELYRVEQEKLNERKRLETEKNETRRFNLLGSMFQDQSLEPDFRKEIGGKLLEGIGENGVVPKFKPYDDFTFTLEPDHPLAKDPSYKQLVGKKFTGEQARLFQQRVADATKAEKTAATKEKVAGSKKAETEKKNDMAFYINQFEREMKGMDEDQRSYIRYIQNQMKTRGLEMTPQLYDNILKAARSSGSQGASTTGTPAAPAQNDSTKAKPRLY